MAYACKFVEVTTGVGVESRGGTGLFCAASDAAIGVAVAGHFVWGGFDIFKVVLGAPVGDLVFLVLLLLDGLVVMGDLTVRGL